MNKTCEYESYRVYTDSISSNTWVNGSQSSFVSHLIRPLKNVTEIKIVSGSFDISGSNVFYIKCDELTSHLNTATGNDELQYDPPTQSVTNGSLIRLPNSSSGRTIFQEYDVDSVSTYFNPIRKLDRLTVTLLDENGELANVISNTFITFKITCNRENFC